MEKDELCKQVLDLDSRIRFAGLINENGRLVAGGMRSGFKEFDKVLGPVKFAMSYRDKLIIMSFPVEENILLISVAKDIDFSKLPFKILDIINH